MGAATNVPTYIGVEVTRRCNLRCPHCFTDSRGRSHPGPDTAALSGLIEQLVAAGATHIAFSGGEPLLREDLEEVMRHGTAAGVKGFSLVTNGSLASLERLRRFRKAGLEGAQVSIDGVDARDHCAVRKCAPRAFYWALRSVRLFRKAGIVVDIATILTPRNAARAAEMLLLAEALGARSLRYCSFVPTGRGTTGEIRELMELTPEAADAFLAFMRKYKSDKRAKLGMLIDHGIGPWKASGEFTCTSGSEVAYISSEGDLYPCPGLIFEPFKVGNVYETPVRDLLRSPALSRIREIPKAELAEPCRSCEVEACSGGCRGSAYAYTGDIRGAPFYCNALRRRAGGLPKGDPAAEG